MFLYCINTLNIWPSFFVETKIYDKVLIKQCFLVSSMDPFFKLLWRAGGPFRPPPLWPSPLPPALPPLPPPFPTSSPFLSPPPSPPPPPPDWPSNHIYLKNNVEEISFERYLSSSPLKRYYLLPCSSMFAHLRNIDEELSFEKKVFIFLSLDSLS